MGSPINGVSLTWQACLIASVCGGAFTPVAYSQEAGLEEIVVTAQRREENVQTVPIAITTVSAAQLEQLNISDSLGVARLVPNLFASNNTGLGTANTYSLRGLNNTESIATFDLPVGTYVDDIYVARQNANNFSLFDVDHVEVLSGPQGTLFGRNTTGGAISINMRKPGDTFGGYVEAGGGNFSERQVRASVDIPVAPTLLTKISAFYKQDDGFVNDVTTHQTLNGNDEKGVRVALRWLASADLTWDLSADYVDQKYANLVNTPTSNGDRIANTGLNLDFPVYPTLFVGPKGNYPLENQIYVSSITSNVTWKTDIGTLNFITGWRDLEQKFSLEFFDSPLPVIEQSGANGGQFILNNEGRHTQFTQEVKLNGSAFADKLTYVTGLFYLNEANTTDLGQTFLLAPFLPAGVCLPGNSFCGISSAIAGNSATTFGGFYYDHLIYNTTHSFAVYGQGDYKLLDNLIATVGARFTAETKSIEFAPNPNPLVPPTNQFTTADMVTAGIPTKQTANIVTPRAALRYDFTPDVNVYASATKGFKGGGWNARASSAALATPFAPEKTWSYELGLRSEWLDHRLRANVTGFYADTKDFQLPSAYVLPGGGGDVFITRNFAGLEVHGVEAEIEAVPIEHLTLFANLGVQEGHYKDLNAGVVAQQHACLAELASKAASTPDCAAGIVTPTGGIAEPVRLPKHSIKAGAAYVIRLGALDLTPNVSIDNSGAYDVETSNNSPKQHSDGYTMIGAGLTLSDGEGSKEHWSVQASCDNCSNRLVIVGELPPTLYYQDPRRWSVIARYKF